MADKLAQMIYFYELSVAKLNKLLNFFLVNLHKLLVFIYTLLQKTLRVTLNGKAYCLFALCLTLWGCSTTLDITSIGWKTYSNSRYGFEFPYPSNWNSLTAPTNDDGIAFVSPRNSNVEIRGWASNQLSPSMTEDSETSASYNFQTTQGLRGLLLVETGNTMSSMKLKLNQNQIDYHWQGKSPSQEFSNYYPLFYYIAQQYRVGRR
ncbi:hypothetical protein [Anabaena azotica]|uniref:hypothetical protein n=1 Tax=Anabaena azotica TaxID=197653 RepID=UPI001F557D21|nr:hypothetical protein [Anabaena azotica]